MAIERWTVQNDGVVHEIRTDVKIVGDYVSNCSYCGTDCDGHYRFWYENNGKRMAIAINRHRLDVHLDQIVAFERNYSKLPRFVRQWNEATGWCSVDAVDGAPVGLTSLRDTVLALRKLPELGDDAEFVEKLYELVEFCTAEKREVWASEM